MFELLSCWKINYKFLKIKKLHIKNFKSIADLEIIEPNPFTVFVGPNGSGKSNIFEALEFLKFERNERLFGGLETLKHRLSNHRWYEIEISTDIDTFIYRREYSFADTFIADSYFPDIKRDEREKQIKNAIQRIFINKLGGQKVNFQDDFRLSFSTDNLEKVLKRVIKSYTIKDEIAEWLSLFIPGFDRMDIISSNLSNTDTLLIYEEGIDKPFTKELLSDGTYNILALLTAVFQSNEPQFLCIEEPENGLTPDVVKEMVTLFRNACEEKGHYIWLNTHSQSLVSQLTPDEIITVNKIKGETKIKQFKGKDFHGLSMDEAWLTNTLGGGLPW